MTSPLLIAQACAAQASESKTPPTICDSNSFSFECSYPEGITQILPFSYQVKAEWDEKDGALYLKSHPLRLTFRSWEGVHPFFDSLDRYAKIFLDSQNILPDEYDEDESDYTRPNGTLYAERSGNERIIPRLESFVEYEDDESFAQNFLSSLSYSCHALHLCRPVFFFIGRQGRPPSLEEMLKLLTKRHSEGQVLRNDSEFGLNTPPPIFFPEGLFGGKVSLLRPQ